MYFLQKKTLYTAPDVFVSGMYVRMYVCVYIHIYVRTSVCIFIPCDRIAARRDAIISRRQRVKQMSADRKTKLLDSLVWQKFSRDADEVRSM